MRCGGSSQCGDADLVRSRAAWLIWCAPAALVVIGALVPAARAALWIPSFLVMGGACLVNARRCGRLHCHLTGPLFLLAAIATFLDATGVIEVAWPSILGASVGGTALGYGLEALRGRYVAR